MKIVKTRHILLYDSANCTVLRAVVLTQYRRVTDRRTDGRNCYSYTALGMRALRRAVKMDRLPVEESFGNKFLSIYDHCGVMAAWSRKTLKKNQVLLGHRQAMSYNRLTEIGCVRPSVRMYTWVLHVHKMFFRFRSNFVRE